MFNLPPSIRISLGLASISLSVLLLGNLLGLVPDRNVLDLKNRKSLAEVVAMQCTLVAQTGKLNVLQQTTDKLTEKYDDVLSIAVRNIGGDYLAESAGHKRTWITPQGVKSSARYWQLPVHRDNQQWGTIEISFKPSLIYSLFGWSLGPFYLLLIFFCLACLVLFYFYIHRVLRAIDPTSVMPSRVRNAFDTLTEGLVLIDDKERIVLANDAIAASLQCKKETLMGMKASRLQWYGSSNLNQSVVFPWQEAIESNRSVYGFPMVISPDGKKERTFMVNSSPIMDGSGKVKGALTTFDDVTELENKNIQLAETVKELKISRDEVQIQNVELERLATRDPMTNCFNRRAFFDQAETLFAKARAEGSKLACVMTDIDKFKLVNDRYGHSVGDQVIIYYASMIQLTLRGDDLFCRYGGEEFCLLLPTCDAEVGAMIANKARQRVRDECPTAVEDEPDIYIAGSFGVSSLSDNPKDLAEMIEFADQALYAAKENGRNKVVIYKAEVKVSINM